MIKVVIIDDESKSRKSLRQKIGDYCAGLTVIGEAANGEEGIEAIRLLNPDLIFLDIEMPKMNGLQMLENLEKFKGAIIFTTAYNEYAIRAFKYSAFDYLLKPVDIHELVASVKRLQEKREKQEQESEAVRPVQLEVLLEHLKGTMDTPKKIAIHTQDALHFFETDEIVRLEAVSNYTTLYFVNGSKMLASKTLKEFEEMLPQKQFFRVHHSTLINLKYVRKYLKGDGGRIEMTDGTLVDISRRKKDDFLETIRQW